MLEHKWLRTYGHYDCYEQTAVRKEQTARFLGAMQPALLLPLLLLLLLLVNTIATSATTTATTKLCYYHCDCYCYFYCYHYCYDYCYYGNCSGARDSTTSCTDTR